MGSRPSSTTALDRTGYEMQRLLLRRPAVCPICQVVGESVTKHVDALFYERVNDIETREAIRKAKGFCRFHARLVSQQADALGTALILQDILINELRAIDAHELDRPRPGTGLLSRLFDSAPTSPSGLAPCPICLAEQTMEEHAADSLVCALSDRKFVLIFRGSTGLCLPHFRLVHARCADEAAWAIVLEMARDSMTRLSGELGELARKTDYRFTDEQIGAESDSWRRALDKTSGWIEK